MSKRKPESQRHPPAAKVLEEFTPEHDPWKELRNKPGIKIVSTGRRQPGCSESTLTRTLARSE